MVVNTEYLKRKVWFGESQSLNSKDDSGSDNMNSQGPWAVVPKYPLLTSDGQAMLSSSSKVIKRHMHKEQGTLFYGSTITLGLENRLLAPIFTYCVANPLLTIQTLQNK